MYTIQNYTDTQCELDIAKSRLNLLIDRREKLYCKYFPITPQLKQDVVDGGDKTKDKMAEYLHDLYDVDIGTGKSLAAEIEYQQENVDKLERYITEMTEALSKMTGIEYQLFFEIINSNKSITQSVKTIADRNNIETRTIWRNQYKKIKKYVKKLKTPLFCQ